LVSPSEENGVVVDQERARDLLEEERRRVQALLDDELGAGQADRSAANETGDIADPAERQTAEEYDDTVAASLRDRLEAIGRAERRLADGTYGRSIRSGLPIPDDRLEADPAAELTLEEAEG
jgi:RNA polymerase-binding transcription factor